MNRRFQTASTGFAGILALLLAACTAPDVAPPEPGDLGAELVELTGQGPPPGPEGACWASDIIPAVIETVTTQVLISPEVRDEAGQITTPASFRTETQTRMVSDRREIWFRAPCAEELTVDFIATLQRALKARGYYLLPLTGALDEATSEAIRRFQADRGLDSPLLSLAAARDLGLIAAERDAL